MSANGDSGISTNRLSKLVYVDILDEDIKINDIQKSCLDKMIKYGPAFPITPEDVEVSVKLSDMGMKMWNKFYVHRPVPSKIDNPFITSNAPRCKL